MGVERSDGELVAAFRAGDDAALEAIYDRHHAWLAQVAFRLTRDRDLALDLLQDAFHYLLRHRARLECGESLRPLLHTIVRHRAIDLGPRKRKPEALRHDPGTPAPSPAEASDLDPLLKPLSPDQREIVLLRFADGLDLASIAETLGLPLGTVKSRLHGAIEILRRFREPS